MLTHTVLYRGPVEIETLARYGRVPPGTRARGEAVLSKTNSPYMDYCIRCHVVVGADPRPVTVELHLSWHGTESKPYTWSQMVRRKMTTFTVNGFLECMTEHLRYCLQEKSTGGGNQRFRFIGVEWVQEQPSGEN